MTGAAGFVGSHLLDALAEHRVSVVAWHKPGMSIDAARARGGPAAQWRAVDILDTGAVTDAMADTRPAVVFHCAGAAHVGDSWDKTHDTFAVNVRGTHRLLEAIRHCGLTPRILIPGSALVYRQSSEALTEDAPIGPASPYAVSKLAQEQLGVRFVSEDNQAVMLTRSFNSIGPRQSPFFAASSFARWIAAIEAGQAEPTIYVGNLDAQRDLTDVRDTVRAYCDLVARGTPGRIYNVCSGRAYPIRDVLDGLLALAQVHVEVQIHRSRLRPNDNPVLLGDAARARTELGWEPRVPLDRTLRDLLDYWRQELAGQTAG